MIESRASFQVVQTSRGQRYEFGNGRRVTNRSAEASMMHVFLVENAN